MKINDALEIIDAGWVQKPKGFRVHFQKKIGTVVTTDYSPGPDESPLDSDVVAWRLAWKLAQAAKGGAASPGGGELMNIYVVDDDDNPVKYYVTNQLHVFRPGEK